MRGRMPGRYRVSSGTGGESGRIRLGGPRRGMSAERQLAYLCHAQLALPLRPSADGFDRLAWTGIFGTLIFKEWKNAISLFRRQKREPPVIPRIAVQRWIRRGFSCSAFHGLKEAPSPGCLFRYFHHRRRIVSLPLSTPAVSQIVKEHQITTTTSTTILVSILFTTRATAMTFSSRVHRITDECLTQPPSLASWHPPALSPHRRQPRPTPPCWPPTSTSAASATAPPAQ